MSATPCRRFGLLFLVSYSRWMTRADHFLEFYRVLGILEEGFGRARMLAECSRLNWPQRGVYFLMEQV